MARTRWRGRTTGIRSQGASARLVASRPGLTSSGRGTTDPILCRTGRRRRPPRRRRRRTTSSARTCRRASFKRRSRGVEISRGCRGLTTWTSRTGRLGPRRSRSGRGTDLAARLRRPRLRRRGRRGALARRRRARRLAGPGWHRCLGGDRRLGHGRRGRCRRLGHTARRCLGYRGRHGDMARGGLNRGGLNRRRLDRGGLAVT